MSHSILSLVALTHRGVLRVTGPDRVGFLQGLLTNDVTAVSAEVSVYAALLTPQGKFLHDVFLAVDPSGAVDGAEGALLLDVDGARREDFAARLRHYRLRAKVDIEDVSDRVAVSALMGVGAEAAVGLSATPGATARFGGGLAMVDARLAGLGVRLLVPSGARATIPSLLGAQDGSADDYHRWRLVLGVPCGTADRMIESALALEGNLDVLNAISWTKGCYVGQEVTARTRYRGLVRRRLRPVRVEGPTPAPGTPVWWGDQEVGDVRSGCGSLALAMLRLDMPEREGAASPTLRAGDAVLTRLSVAWDRPTGVSNV